MVSHKSDSSEQRRAEMLIIKTLELKLGLNFNSNSALPIELNVKPDAVDLANKTIVEIYSRIGKVKGGQLHKLKGDILKLALIEKKLGQGWRKIMCFASEEASRYLRGNTWVAEAVKEFGIEIHVIQLPENVVFSLESAQKRQRMINSHE